MSESEIDELFKLTYLRAKATQNFLDGKLPPDEYLDFMEATGIDPIELLDQAESNLEFAIADGIELEL